MRATYLKLLYMFAPVESRLSYANLHQQLGVAAAKEQTRPKSRKGCGRAVGSCLETAEATLCLERCSWFSTEGHRAGLDTNSEVQANSIHLRGLEKLEVNSPLPNGNFNDFRAFFGPLGGQAMLVEPGIDESWTDILHKRHYKR